MPAGSALADLASRGEQIEALQAQVRRVGGCEQPIRLRGHADLVDIVTGEVRQAWSSEDLPDDGVLIACGNRRASRCAPCSRLYQGDAFQLIAAGLRGGKGVPDTITGHPALFVTLTAPSFGPVHTINLDRHGDPAPCHGRADAGTCEHGVPSACWIKHTPADPLAGQAICDECFDYEAAVLWHAHASELWRRTRIDLYRQLAKLTGQTEKAVKTQVRVEYVKVAEYQRRGLLHYHAALRLDAATTPFAPPPEGYTAELLTAAIRAAVAHVEAPYPTPTPRPSPPVDVDQLALLTEREPRSVEAGQGLACGAGRNATLDARPSHEGGSPGRDRGPYPARPALAQPSDPSYRLPALRLDDRPALHAARWGSQLHIETIPVDGEDGQGLSRGQVAGYLAKYATKHTEALGRLDRRVTAADLPTLPVNRHVGRFVATALRLPIRYPTLKAGRWAHQLGYGGHWLTKSRRWSTTFTALRQERRDYNAARNPDPATPAEHEQRRASWQTVGVGYRLPGDALLAAGVRSQAETAREAIRELRAELDELQALAS